MKKIVLLCALSLIGVSLGGCAVYEDGYYGGPGYGYGIFDGGGGWWGGGHHHYHGGGGHGHGHGGHGHH